METQDHLEVSKPLELSLDTKIYLQNISYFYYSTVLLHLYLLFLHYSAFSIEFDKVAQVLGLVPCHYSYVAAFDQAKHCFAFKAQALRFVKVISCPFVQALRDKLEFVLSDSFTVVDHIKAI